jgi:hypothetical protein
MVCLQTKNPNLGKFRRVLLWKILVYFMTIWSTYVTAIGNFLWPFGIFGGNLVYFPPIRYFGLRKIWQPWAGGFSFGDVKVELGRIVFIAIVSFPFSVTSN